MNRRKHRFTTSVAALSAALLWCGAATAQTALRVADSFPTGHYIAENQTKPWMEKVKELMAYDQLSLSEIAYETGFSSVHHLSAQFKKITGSTPSQYKAAAVNDRLPLDLVGA